jgi:hypothetical protein
MICVSLINLPISNVGRMASGRPPWAGRSRKVLPRTSRRALVRISRHGWSRSMTFFVVLMLVILLVLAYLIGRHDRDLIRERLRNDPTESSK